MCNVMAEVYGFVISVLNEVMDEKDHSKQYTRGDNDQKYTWLSTCCFFDIHET